MCSLVIKFLWNLRQNSHRVDQTVNNDDSKPTASNDDSKPTASHDDSKPTANDDDSDDSDTSNLDDYIGLDAASVEERDRKHALRTGNAISSSSPSLIDDAQPSCSYWTSAARPPVKRQTASPDETKNVRRRDKFPIDKPFKQPRTTLQKFKKALKEYAKCSNDARAAKKYKSILFVAANVGSSPIRTLHVYGRIITDKVFIGKHYLYTHLLIGQQYSIERWGIAECA